MTRLEAIRILDPETTIEALSEIEYYAGFSGQTAKVQAVNEACVVAVEAMRRLSELESNSQALESNAPLTLDELREMDGEPVWVCSLGGDGKDIWAFVDTDCEMVRIFVTRFSVKCMVTLRHFKAYGKTWLAYRHKPEEGTDKHETD